VRGQFEWVTQQQWTQKPFLVNEMKPIARHGYRWLRHADSLERGKLCIRQKNIPNPSHRKLNQIIEKRGQTAFAASNLPAGRVCPQPVERDLPQPTIRKGKTI
jgi:hypothetical protein